MVLGTLKTIDCESEPCVVRADAPVIGKEPSILAGQGSEISNQFLKDIIKFKNLLRV
jgi:hypothetical protein